MIETENSSYGIDMEIEDYGLKMYDESVKKYANIKSMKIAGGVLRLIKSKAYTRSSKFLMKGYQYDKSN